MQSSESWEQVKLEAALRGDVWRGGGFEDLVPLEEKADGQRTARLGVPRRPKGMTRTEYCALNRSFLLTALAKSSERSRGQA